MSALMRALLAGQLGMAILFGLDALDSTRLFRRSTQRIRTDAETLALLTGAVTDYAVRIAVAHAVLGLLLAGLLHWGVRFSSPRPPSGWRWWASAGVLFVLLFGMGHAQQLYIFPAMYDVVPNVAGLVDSVSLAQIQAVTAGVWMLVLGAVLLRWRASGAGWGQRMGRAALPLAAWSGLVGLSLSNPAPTESQDNQAMNVVILGVDSLRPDHLGFYLSLIHI